MPTHCPLAASIPTGLHMPADPCEGQLSSSVPSGKRKHHVLISSNYQHQTGEQQLLHPTPAQPWAASRREALGKQQEELTAFQEPLPRKRSTKLQLKRLQERPRGSVHCRPTCSQQPPTPQHPHTERLSTGSCRKTAATALHTRFPRREAGSAVGSNGESRVTALTPSTPFVLPLAATNSHVILRRKKTAAGELVV